MIERFFTWVADIKQMYKLLIVEHLLVLLYTVGGISLGFSVGEIVILTLIAVITIGIVFDFLPRDKQGHLLMGIMTFTVALFVSLIFVGSCLSVFIAMTSVVIVGISKEIYDWSMNTFHGGHHGVESMDALATTLLPIVLGLTYVEMCSRILKLHGI